MNKRTFIKLLSAVIAGRSFLPRILWATGDKIRNWAGNVEYSTESLSSVTSMEQVRDFVRKHSKFKVLGTRHCFNKIADSKDHLLSLKSLDEMVALDSHARTVTVDAGMTYGKLSPLLIGHSRPKRYSYSRRKASYPPAARTAS